MQAAPDGPAATHRHGGSSWSSVLLVSAIGLWRWLREPATGPRRPSPWPASFPWTATATDQVFMQRRSPPGFPTRLGKPEPRLRTGELPIRTVEQARKEGAALLIRGSIHHQGDTTRVFARRFRADRRRYLHQELQARGGRSERGRRPGRGGNCIRYSDLDRNLWAPNPTQRSPRSSCASRQCGGRDNCSRSSLPGALRSQRVGPGAGPACWQHRICASGTADGRTGLGDCHSS